MITVRFAHKGFEFEIEFDETTAADGHSLVADCVMFAEEVAGFLGTDLLPDSAKQQGQQTSRRDYKAPSQNPAQETIDMKAEFIRHSYEGGQHRYRLGGGAWRKYGVAVYPEVITPDDELRAQIFEAPLGDTACDIDCRVLVRHGKPYKIVSVK